MKPYQPSGAVRLLLEAVQADPARVLTCAEAAKVMGIARVKVYGSVAYAVRAGVLHKGKRGEIIVLSGSPIPEEAPKPKKGRHQPKDHQKPVAAGWTTDPNDPRIQKVTPGWQPPKMVCVRSAA